MRNIISIRILFLIIVFSIFAVSSYTDGNTYAQNARTFATGTVVDEQGQPIPGVNVLCQNSNYGTTTTIDGTFKIQTKGKNPILEFSFIGFQKQEITIKDPKKLIKVVMIEDGYMLDETVVIGYGTQTKRTITSAMTSIKSEELSGYVGSSIEQTISGLVPGVRIQTSDATPGGDINVEVRGIGTVTAGSEPLYIVDGIPMEGGLSAVNPDDVSNIQILKDAASTAVYGSRGANGVILITTKRGESAKPTITINAATTIAQIQHKFELMNTAQLLEYYKDKNLNERFRYTTNQNQDYFPFDENLNTDWQDAMLRGGVSQNYMFSIRGGSENAQYSLSYNHADEKGIFLGNNYRQDNARLKLHMNKYIFDIDANIAFKFTDSKQPEYSIKEMYMISPLVPIYDDTREYGFGLSDFDDLPSNRNVMADQHYEKSTDKKYHTTANVALTMNFTPWLNFKTSYAYRGEHQRQTYHTPAYVADPKAKRDYPYHSETTGYWEEHVWENVLSFNKTFGKHNVNAMAGTSMTARKYTWNSVGVEGKTTVYKVEDGKLITSEIPGGFLDPSFSTVGAGAGGTFDGSGTKWKYNRASFFGRLNYNYNDRYLVQATVRYDGSSKFGKDNRWGCFPSVALGWRISQEEFFPKDIALNNLKFRVSWGRLGNENALGYYDFLALISTYNEMYQGYVKGNGDNAWAGSIARGLENRSLKWETTDTKNIGFDFGFFNSKLTGTLNYYYNQTEDLLITKVLPPSAGMTNPTLNVGKIRNTGFELELNWGDAIKDFDYNIGFNMSTTKNKVVELSDADQVLQGEGLKYGTEHFPTETRVGKPIGAFYLYRTDGIFQSMDEVNAHVNKDGQLLQPNAQPGDIRFKDLDGNGSIDAGDKEYCGSGIPTLEANLNLSFGYKGFDLSIVLGSAWNFKLYNGNKYFYEGMNSKSNMLKSTLNAWTPDNRNTDVPRAVYQDPNGNMKESDRFLENGDFVRLRQAQLGYTLPKSLMQKFYIEKLRFYVSGENLFTITGYDGIDPEFSRASVLNTGVDKLIYPFTRSFTVGAQLTF